MEDKTDFVWCDVVATGNVIDKPNMKFSCSIKCEVAYGLYNDGWHLDTCTCNIVASSIKPLYYPTKERIERVATSAFILASTDRVEVHDMIQKSNTEIVYPVDIYYHDGETKSKELTLYFYIDGEGWRYKGPGCVYYLNPVS